MNADCPCQCGHALHFRGACSECGCPRSAPDYLAAALASGELASLPEGARDARRELLRSWNAQIAEQLGYTGPPRPGKTHNEHRTRCVCAYCGQPFAAVRSHAETCSGACRQALSVARRYADEADVPPASTRRETFSTERAARTGSGLMSATECYEADVRVVRARSAAGVC